MKSKTIGGITLVIDPTEGETVGLIDSACAKAIQLIRETWGLEPPADCRIYVMTSWLGFIFQSAPWPWRILLAATLPLWAGRARRTWPYSAAWTQRYGKRVAIGVKPPHLWEQSDKSIGAQMFVEEPDTAVKVQNITCHELTHACSAHLRLPMWLNEGIATVTAERFLEKRTIREDTLALVRGFQPKAAPPTYRQLSRMGGKAIAYQAVRGYWLTRYLEEQHPGLLKSLLSQRREPGALEREIAAALAVGSTATEPAGVEPTGVEPAAFWQRIDDTIADCFEGK